MTVGGSKKDVAGRIAIFVVGLLVILGIIIVSKAFFRGMLVGVALAGCAITIFWMMRTMRKKG
ncbi:hypothetical protein ES703_32229 [subsurface metagenome]